MNDAKGDRASNQKTFTITSDRKKRKVTYTSNADLQQKLLSNRTLLIITTMMNPHIDDMVASCGSSSHTFVAPTMKEVITDVVCISAQVLQTPRHISRTDRDSNTPGDTPQTVRSPRDNSPVLIGGIGVSPASGHSGILQVFNKPQSTVSDKIRDTQKFDTSIDRKLSDDQDSASIFSKVIGCELSHGSRADLYLCFRMDFKSNVV